MYILYGSYLTPDWVKFVVSYTIVDFFLLGLVFSTIVVKVANTMRSTSSFRNSFAIISAGRGKEPTWVVFISCM